MGIRVPMVRGCFRSKWIVDVGSGTRSIYICSMALHSFSPPAKNKSRPNREHRLSCQCLLFSRRSSRNDFNLWGNLGYYIIFGKTSVLHMRLFFAGPHWKQLVSHGISTYIWSEAIWKVVSIPPNFHQVFFETDKSHFKQTWKFRCNLLVSLAKKLLFELALYVWLDSFWI